MTTLSELPIAELRRLADEVYPVELDEKENKDKKLAAAALEAVGASWAQYLKNHATDEIREKYITEYNTLTNSENVTGAGVVTSSQVTGEATTVAPVQESEVKIITQEAPKVTEKYLVKMVRENPLYQVGPYKFTQTHPYALVEGAHLRNILENEDGFRQAYPDEIADFYQ